MFNWLPGPLLIILFSFLFFVLLFIFYRFFYFLRDPGRTIPGGNNIVAPADGFILYIKTINQNRVPVSIKNKESIALPEIMDGAEHPYHLVIGIFMTPFSVHYNRFPFAGQIKNMIYRNSRANQSMLGSFLNLILNLKPYSADSQYILENERNTTLLSAGQINGAIVQIADKWVNKIKNSKQTGDQVKKGEKLGLIRMGSQCDLFLDIQTNYRIVVKERDYVKAGTSILIELDEK